MADQRKKKEKSGRTKMTRRDFLQISRSSIFGAGILSIMPTIFWVDEVIAAIPVSEGYLLVDTKKCQGCMICMMTCSLVHHGKVNLSLARLQIVQDSFQKYPLDIMIAQCRQCAKPECLIACQFEAIQANEKNGNVRMIDKEKCVGCMACVEACPFSPSRSIRNQENGKAQKCDLCYDAPFWNEQGGVSNNQACVKMCPMKAIVFTAELPNQKGDNGYQINLRGAVWKKLGFPTN